MAMPVEGLRNFPLMALVTHDLRQIAALGIEQRVREFIDLRLRPCEIIRVRRGFPQILGDRLPNGLGQLSPF